MLEIILWYVLPTIILFGGIYVISKLIEKFVWFMVDNHDNIMSGKPLLRRKK